MEAGDAITPSAVPLHEEWSDNLAFDYEYGDHKSTEPGFASAAHVVGVSLHAQRIAVNLMEPKSCAAIYDGTTSRFEIYIPTQGTAALKAAFAVVTCLPPESFRIHSADVGGGFGVRVVRICPCAGTS